MPEVKATPEQILLIKTNAPNFLPHELACRCCGALNMTTELLTKLQALRNYMRIPLTINSGYRCNKHNAAVGGKQNSRHLKGQAIDISLKLDVPKEGTKEGIYLHKMMQMIPHLFNGIGVAETFVHCDVRDTKSFWHY